jgi:ligand-binding sensor domain-containing protein
VYIIFKPSANTLQHYSKQSAPIKLNNDIINGVIQDNKGLIWIATDHGGINIINKQSGSVFALENNPYDNTTISQNSLNAIYKDDLGIIWLGTYKRGVSYYHETAFKFHLYRHQPLDANSLPYDDINKFAEDK